MLTLFGRRIFPESRKRKYQVELEQHLALLSCFTDEERRRYSGLAMAEEIASANTAALNEMEAVAAVRLYEQAKKLDNWGGPSK